VQKTVNIFVEIRYNGKVLMGCPASIAAGGGCRFDVDMQT
jgi:hypothetical protein